MKKLKRVFYIFILLFYSALLYSENAVDTIAIHSKKMDKDINNIVILPDRYFSENTKRFPVVYLLHGYGANYTTWLNVIRKDLPQLANLYNFIIVCPDGGNSWYWDSPINKRSQYETYTGVELVNSIDSIYRTKPNAKSRAITGFSMGGHGALWLTAKYPNIFGACGSMSGGVDILPFPRNWEIPNLLGPYKENEELWASYTVINNLNGLRGKKIIIDCGKSDFFLQVNNELHKKMNDFNIPHEYIITEGGHTPAYWRKAIDIQLKFFSDFFN